MMRLLQDAGYESDGLKGACDKVYNSCNICTSFKKSHKKKKVSLTNVNEAFNQELQAEFMVVYISNEKFDVLNITDVGAEHGERAISSTRSFQSMKQTIETIWIYRHGAPKNFAAEPEFSKSTMINFLNSHNIQLLPRPSRSSYKYGKVERNNEVFKSVLDKVS